jgi:AraC family transcriptional regulator, transcriptional activator of pobA
MKYHGANNSFINLAELRANEAALLSERGENVLSIVWNTGEPFTYGLDGFSFQLATNEVLFFTSLQEMQFSGMEQVRLVRFNRNFYCIREHDHEVSCRGILFFNPQALPKVSLPENEEEKFHLLWKIFQMEMATADKLQMEMLQMLLKRLIILCTRLYKQQSLGAITDNAVELVREFLYLVEDHYKTQHSVAFYAEKLNRSAKTISNVFAKLRKQSPQEIIHERLFYEAKRLIFYTDKSVKEIGFELGFEEISTFSRFFKNKEGISPSEFREQIHIPA